MTFALFSRPKPRAPAPPQERLHQVAGRTLPLKIVENARARRLTLRIDAGGRGLRVTTPVGLPAREVDRFLDRQRGWLEARLEKLPERPQVRPGTKLPVRGVPHLIVHEPGMRGTVTVRPGSDRARENLAGTTDRRASGGGSATGPASLAAPAVAAGASHGETDACPALIVCGDRRHLPRRLADFLKREARRDIAAMVDKHTATVGRRAKAIRFRDTVSRWGSCTADGTLSFSWRIMMAPRPVIDYLVAHEVAHLKEMNHGPRFWALCRALCPDTDRCRAWLKKNGTALQAIAFE